MIKFTVFSDLHYDELPNGDKQIEELVGHIKAINPDFVISLGDLCDVMDSNKERVLDKFNSLGIPIYHMIGNHETDSCNLASALEFLSMKSAYYAFEFDDIKFIVLNSCYFNKDGQDIAYLGRNYREGNSVYPILPKAELEWLEEELSDGKKYVIFSHHSLINDFRDRGIFNREEIRKLFKGKDILLCMNGHDHGDDFKTTEGIPYYTVNSAGYVWCGFQIMSSEKLLEKYGYLKGCLFYKHALYVDVEIGNSQIGISGIDGEYLFVTPADVGLNDYIWNGVSIKPHTSSVVIDLKKE